MIHKEDFLGVVFDTFEVSASVAEGGGRVAMQLDGEVFDVPFFEGSINLEGLTVGNHRVRMTVINAEGAGVGRGDEVEFSII